MTRPAPHTEAEVDDSEVGYPLQRLSQLDYQEMVMHREAFARWVEDKIDPSRIEHGLGPYGWRTACSFFDHVVEYERRLFEEATP